MTAEVQPSPAPRVENRRLPILALLGGATGIGFAPILVRFSETGPSATAAVRILLALPILWFLLWLERRKGTKRGQSSLPVPNDDALADKAVRAPCRGPTTLADFKYLAIAGLFFSADLSIWHWSLQFTTVANSTLLTNFAPVFVTVGAFFLFGERLSLQFIVGLVLAIAGAALLVLRSVDLSHRAILGDVIALVAACFYAGYLLSVKGLRRRFSTITIMAWSGLVSCPALFLIAFCSGERILPTHAHGWYVLIALAIVGHVAGQTLIAFALGHLPASFSSVSLLLQPIVAAVVAWLLLSERLGILQIIGGLITLAGIIVASQARTGLKSGL